MQGKAKQYFYCCICGLEEHMGRKSVYQKEKSEQEIAKEVEEIMYLDPISAKQMAAYLSVHSRGHIHFDERKVRKRIEEICKMSDGQIETKDFVKNPNLKKSKYLFKPEWQGLLMALMDTNYFDDRKNDRLLNTRENLYHDLIVNIDLYLDAKDQEIVKSYPGYKLAYCECKAIEYINSDIQCLIRNAMHADETIRLKMLSDIHDALSELNENNNRMSSQIWANKLVYKSNINNRYLEKLFESDSLPLFMVELLALKVKEKKYSTFIEEGILTYEKLYAAAKIENPMELPSNEDYDKFIEDIDKKLDENDYYNDMINRIESIINIDNPIERQLLCDFKNITRNRLMMEGLNRNEIKKMKKYIDACMQRNMFDILNMFLNDEKLDTPLTVELSRIRDMKPIIENKQKTEK